MKVNANIKAGRVTANYNEKTESDKKSKSLTLKTGIKAGGKDENWFFREAPPTPAARIALSATTRPVKAIPY